jgi:hypothetical protein
MNTVPAILMVATMILTGCASDKPAATTCEPATAGTACCAPVRHTGGAPQALTVVDSLAPIKDAFNAHADKPRVLLLVSPACSECVLGAQAVRKSIVDRFAQSGVVPIVVWEPMLAPDNEEAARGASAIFADTRALQFYDPDRHAGWAYERERFAGKWDELEAALPADHWLRKAHDRKPDPAPEWDVYMLFKPGVRWADKAPKPDAFIRHIGRDTSGKSHFFRDRFDSPPARGDLFEAMEQMCRDVLDGRRAMSVELLGFPGCPNTPELRESVRAAIASVGGGITFEEVNQEALDESDRRRGWPAPTVLVDGSDLFGMPAPQSPSMGCRVYEGGVPDTAVIAERLRALHGAPQGGGAR